MKNYEILATHQVYRRYRVPADSEAEAEQRLRDVYYEGAEDLEIRLLEEWDAESLDDFDILTTQEKETGYEKRHLPRGQL